VLPKTGFHAENFVASAFRVPSVKRVNLVDVICDDISDPVSRYMSGEKKMIVGGNKQVGDAAIKAYDRGDVKLAIRLANEMVSAQPNNPECLQDRAFIYERMGDPKSFALAEADLNKAVELKSHPRAHELLTARARALSKAGKKELALKDCAAAIELDPNYGTAYYTRASILDSLGRHKEELIDRRKLVEMRPREYRNVLCFAVVLSKAGANGREDLLKALELLNGVIKGDNKTQDAKLLSRSMPRRATRLRLNDTCVFDRAR
jgi:tetratricopeptide (TPR) repeat protein